MGSPPLCFVKRQQSIQTDKNANATFDNNMVPIQQMQEGQGVWGQEKLLQSNILWLYSV